MKHKLPSKPWQWGSKSWSYEPGLRLQDPSRDRIVSALDGFVRHCEQNISETSRQSLGWCIINKWSDWFQVTTKQEAHSIIKGCLETNSAWVETFNELGCVLAFDLDPMLEGTVTVDFIVKDLWDKGIRATQDEVVKSICSYAIENDYIWSVETIFDNYDYTAKTLENLGEDSKALLTELADESGNEAFKTMVTSGS